MTSEQARLDKNRIERLLHELARTLGARSVELDIVIVGGAAVALTERPERDGTIDIDVFGRLSPDVQVAIEEIASREHLPTTWLNNNAQQFASPTATHSDLPPYLQHGTATIRVLDRDSLLAMKLRSGRLSKDGDDIVALISSLNLQATAEAEAILNSYYDGEEAIKPAARQLLDSHFAAFES